MILKPGDRFKTKYGPATVIGFERFTSDGKSSFLSVTDVEGSNSRVRCRLDIPENWSLHATGGDPYFMRSDLRIPLTPLPEDDEDGLFNAKPDCKHETYCAPGGGIKCVHCPGWFCY